MNDKKEQGVKAVNQAFSAYEQVEKQQVYNLSEHADKEAFDTDYQIKTCDMSNYFSGGETGKAQFAQELGSALESIGFAILINHKVDPALYQMATKKTAELFESTTVEQRKPYLAQRHGSVNQGYFPIKETTIIHPDLVEGWVFCRRAFNLDGQADFQEQDFWPIPGYEASFRPLVQQHEALVLPIMQSILSYLNCDPHCYDDKLSGTNFGFRLNYYPAMQGAEEGGRMLGHEDVDLFTLLPAANVDGLQVLNRSNMQWVRLQAPPGSIIINTGDYMQRITNNRLPSTTHRVSRPTNSEDLSVARISFPMAVYVWEEQILEVLPGLGEPKYAPISAIEFHTKITSKYYGDDYAVGDK